MKIVLYLCKQTHNEMKKKKTKKELRDEMGVFLYEGLQGNEPLFKRVDISDPKQIIVETSTFRKTDRSLRLKTTNKLKSFGFKYVPGFDVYLLKK